MQSKHTWQISSAMFFGLYVLCAPALSTFVLIFWSQFEDLETFKGEVA